MWYNDHVAIYVCHHTRGKGEKKMQTELSIRKLTQNVRHVYRCCYCELQEMLDFIPAIYYNHGVYGWNCDIYYFPIYDLAITTGYRKLAGVNIPRCIIKKYNEEAKAIKSTNSEYCFSHLMYDLAQNMCYELLSMKKNEKEETN